MASSSNDWGKDSSRTEVVCGRCEKVMRKDNLARHFAKCHPGVKEICRHKIVEGQKSLSSFFSSKAPGKPVRIPTSTPVKGGADELDISSEEMLDVSKITPTTDVSEARDLADLSSSSVPGHARRVLDLPTSAPGGMWTLQVAQWSHLRRGTALGQMEKFRAHQW